MKQKSLRVLKIVLCAQHIQNKNGAMHAKYKKDVQNVYTRIRNEFGWMSIFKKFQKKEWNCHMAFELNVQQQQNTNNAQFKY